MKESLRRLSAKETLLVERMALELQQEMMLEDFDPELTTLLCEYAAFCWLAVETGGGRRFLSPRAVLEECSLEQLADYYETYCAEYLTEGESADAV